MIWIFLSVVSLTIYILFLIINNKDLEFFLYIFIGSIAIMFLMLIFNSEVDNNDFLELQNAIEIAKIEYNKS